MPFPIFIHSLIVKRVKCGVNIHIVMMSIITATLVITLLMRGLQADESISSEKIIIHVPYKIHNHLHTHTNYKIIKVPEHESETLHEPSEKEEQMKYLHKEIDSILSGTKLPNHFKPAESQVKPQTFQNFNDETISQPLISGHGYHDLKEIKKLENYHHVHDESINDHLISQPTRLPTLSPKFHTTVPDYQYGEGNLYFHTYSTKAPFVPIYNAQIVNPTYQVEENQASEETHQTKSYEPFVKSNAVSKSNNDLYIRNYLKKYPYTIRSGKLLQTTKSINVPTTKIYSVPTIATKTYTIPTVKTFSVATTKVPKTIYKNNEEYEHIGYLVVGEKSQKFVGVNGKEN